MTPGTLQGSATVRPPTFKPNRDRLARYSVLANGTIDAASKTIFIASPPVQITQLDPNAINVTFPLNIDASDLLVAVQHSTNLATWTDNGVTHEFLAIANGVQTIRARIPHGNAKTKHFLRA